MRRTRTCPLIKSTSLMQHGSCAIRQNADNGWSSNWSRSAWLIVVAHEHDRVLGMAGENKSQRLCAA
jgi:hypothetical protein